MNMRRQVAGNRAYAGSDAKSIMAVKVDGLWVVRIRLIDGTETIKSLNEPGRTSSIHEADAYARTLARDIARHGMAVLNDKQEQT